MFEGGLPTDYEKIQSGVPTGIHNKVVLSFDTFEDGLIVGRFAKLLDGSLNNVDATASPVIAGVVLRKPTNPLEAENTIRAEDNHNVADVIRQGLVSVEVVDGDEPAMFDQVYVDITTSSSYGKATVTSTSNVEVEAEFIREIDTNIWLIRLK